MKRRKLSSSEDLCMEVECVKNDKDPMCDLPVKDLVNYVVPQGEVQLVEKNEQLCPWSLSGSQVERNECDNQIARLREEQTHTSEIIRTRLNCKLELIRSQMEALRNEAQKSVNEAKECIRIHRAACNFTKLPGSIYNLYRKSSGQEYLSMLSPLEWNGQPPHEFIGQYKLESDLSWTQLQ